MSNDEQNAVPTAHENDGNTDSELTETAPAEDVEFGDAELMKWVPGEPKTDTEEHSLIMTHCPVCGEDGCIYGGNLWGTTPCCYSYDENLRLEYLIAMWILDGCSKDEVARKLIALNIPPDFRREYIDRIAKLLDGGWGASVARKYRTYLDGIAVRLRVGPHDSGME